MNGTATKRIPKFLEGEPLPAGYFEPVNPYISAPSRKIRIGDLASYMKKNGKTMWDLTKDEIKMFENKNAEQMDDPAVPLHPFEH